MYNLIMLILLIVGLFKVDVVMIAASGLYAIAGAINYFAFKYSERAKDAPHTEAR